MTPQATALGAAEDRARAGGGASGSSSSGSPTNNNQQGAGGGAGASGGGVNNNNNTGNFPNSVPGTTEDAFGLSMRLMFSGSNAGAGGSGPQRKLPVQQQGGGVSPGQAGLGPCGAQNPQGSVRSCLFRGTLAEAHSSVCDALATMVPGFQRPAAPVPELRGHAMFKGAGGGKGSVLTYLVELRPVHVGAPGAVHIECKYGIGEAADFAAFFTALVQKLPGNRIASQLNHPPWSSTEFFAARGKK
jgi:hypothetical protein